MHRLALAHVFVMCAALAGLCAEGVPQQDPNIQYLVIVKDNNVQQERDGTHHVLQWEFFSEVFLFRNASIPQPTLYGPGMAAKGILFEHTGHESNHTVQNTSWEWQAWAPPFHTEAQLDELYPDGVYQVRLDSPPLRSLSFLIDERRALTKDGQGIPPPISVTLWQVGRQVLANEIDASKDLLVRWSHFAAGGADPNGICDDLVYFKVKHANGTVIVRTGGPTGSCSGEVCQPMLTFRNESYFLAAGFLPRHAPLIITVEQAKIVSSWQHGIPTLASFGTTTYFPVATQMFGPVSAQHTLFA